MLDLWLAIAHHVLVFGLAIMLAMELACLRAPAPPIARLARLDAGYGMTSILILVVGACRVLWGVKGWEAYQANPFFWAKIGTFLLIGLISIVPTIGFIKWARALRSNPDFAPPPAAVARIGGLVRIELLLLFPLVGFAAAMARY
jgi:putative membrane protein